MSETSTRIKVSVELFGVPRLKAGRGEMGLELPADVAWHDLIEAVARECPVLVGPVLRQDLTDLQDGYVFNHNGVSFLSAGPLHVQSGDFLMLLSSQAGG